MSHHAFDICFFMNFPFFRSRGFSFFISVLFALWGLFLVLVFVQTHPNYIMGIFSGNEFYKGLFIGLPIFLFVFAFSSGILYLFFLRFRRLPLWAGLLLFWGIQIFSPLFFGFFKQIFSNIPFSFSSLESLFQTTFLHTFGVVFFTLFLIFLGRILARKYSFSEFQHFTLGFLAFSFFGFFLVLLHVFSLSFLLGFVVLMLLFFWKYFLDLLKKTFSFSFPLSYPIIFFGGLVFALFALNFLQSFFPFSLGWDSLTQYLLTTKTLLSEGVFRSGIFPPFTEIVLSSGGLFLGISFVQFLLVCWGMSLGATLLYFGQKLKIPLIWNLFLTALFLFLPAVEFQLSRDLKFDLIFLQFILVVFVFWQERYFKISAFLLGFCVLVKLTALWFFPFFFLILFFQKISWKEKISSFCLLFLPLFVWGSVNMISNRTFPPNFSSFVSSFLQTPSRAPALHINPSEKIDISSSSIVPISSSSPTGIHEELGRYAGYSHNPFRILWSCFTNSEIPSLSKQYTDTGFWWMIILPFFLLSLFFNRQHFSRTHFEILICTFGFFFFWLFMGQAVPWYGFPFFAILLFFTGYLIAEQSFLFRIIFSLFFAISLFFGIFSRLEHSTYDAFATSSLWVINTSPENTNMLLVKFFPDEIRAAGIINSLPQAFVFRIGTMARFWIQNGDARILEDPQLDQFQSIFFPQDMDKTLAILKQNNFRFLLFDRAADTIETNPNGTLHKKVSDFVSFAQSKLKMILLGYRLVLFEIQ